MKRKAGPRLDFTEQRRDEDTALPVFAGVGGQFMTGINESGSSMLVGGGTLR